MYVKDKERDILVSIADYIAVVVLDLTMRLPNGTVSEVFPDFADYRSQSIEIAKRISKRLKEAK